MSDPITAVLERQSGTLSDVMPPEVQIDMMEADETETWQDDDPYADQDGAQNVLQPAISAAATRLTSLNTPAAEKAAAMNTLPGGGDFDGGPDEPTPDLSPVAEETPRPEPVAAPGPRKLQKERVPTGPCSPTPHAGGLSTPWEAVPKDLVVGDDTTHPKSALEFIFRPTRHKRSPSTGAEALKKIKEAFPSFSTPSNFLPSFSTSFFSTANEKKESSGQTTPIVNSASPVSPSANIRRPHSNTEPPRPDEALRRTKVVATADDSSILRSSNDSSGPRVVRRVTSHDSILYHTLSRASSLGDDDRFQNVREMANVRFKAIRDSLPERPSFKLPSLPKLSTQLKKYQLADEVSSPAPETSVPSRSDTEITANTKDSLSDLDKVLETLTGDVVVMGGYRGSVLRSAEPPHQQLWAPVKIGLNMRKADLEVGLDPEDEETMEERIIPSGMLKNIGPIDIARKFFKKLRSCENARTGKLRIWDYGYDWRLSPHRLSRRLLNFLKNLPSNRSGVPAESRGALVIAHSLGGIITRHVVNQRPDLFSGVLYAGTPQRCVNILGPIRNGDAVLLNEKILTAQVNFSLRTSFIFLPEDGFCFINRSTGEEYRVDFYDVNDWIKYRFSPCIEPPLPPFLPRQSSGLGSLLPNLPLRGRKDSAASEKRPSYFPNSGSSPIAELSRKADYAKEKAVAAPQIDANPPGTTDPKPHTLSPATRSRNVAYLARTLAEVKRFRAELAHNPLHAAANAYPPLALMYGKDTPTVYATKVSAREAIACADVYDDLVFRSGDGVVLAKEAMLPEGYELVRGGRVSTDRGHLTMLGDLPAVGRALEAVVRGRKKGIGLGNAAGNGKGRMSTAG
jgi:pimeloyl-ACP methyl ester carboxylesterase